MDFKKFEEKLLIENFVNYCIENNISAREVNNLTAKIKLGRLDEANSWFGDTLAKLGTGTATQKYNYAIKLIQNDLQNAINSLNKVDSNLSPSNKDNIFKKYNINMTDDKKDSLRAAVAQLKSAIDQYAPSVKQALGNVGGQVSGVGSDYEEGSDIDLQKLIPNLYSNDLANAFTTAYGGASYSNFKLLRTNIIKNISGILKNSDPSKYNQIAVNIKNQIAKIITDLPDASKREEAYASLYNLAKGTSGTPTATTPAPIVDEAKVKQITNYLLTQGYSDMTDQFVDYMSGIRDNQNPKKQFKDLITNLLNRNIRQQDIMNAYEDAFDKNKKFLYPSGDTTKPPIDFAANPNEAVKLINRIINAIELSL